MSKLNDASRKREVYYGSAPVSSPRTFVSRGAILAGVLDGTNSCVQVGVVTDTSDMNPEEDIPYDPNSDLRLDKFDALECGFEETDASAGSSKDASSGEEKE